MKSSTINKSFLLFLAILFIPLSSSYSESEKSSKEKVHEMYRGYQKNFAAVKEIKVADAIKENNDSTVLFVDIRTKGEISVSTLPKAVTKDDFLRDKALYKDKKIIAYCTIGYRSGLFAAEMEKEGITVYNLSAGILGWIHEGGKVYDSRGIVQRVHVYGKDWDYAPEGFETMTFGLLEKIMN